jgi:hypothetical protein
MPGCRLRARFLLPAILLMAGCATSPKRATEPMGVDRTEYARMYEAARAVLRERGFRIASASYRYGRIRTAPKPAATWLGLGRGHHRSAAAVWESTLHEQRRRVRVLLWPEAASDARPGAAAEYQMQVEAILQRRVDPQRMLTGVARGRQLWGRARIDRGGDAPTRPYWYTVRRDGRLETALRDAIVRRAMELSPSGEKPGRASSAEET